MEPLAVEHYPLSPSKASVALARQIGRTSKREAKMEPMKLSFIALPEYLNRAILGMTLLLVTVKTIFSMGAVAMTLLSLAVSE